jgi:hypothetical protein
VSFYARQAKSSARFSACGAGEGIFQPCCMLSLRPVHMKAALPLHIPPSSFTLSIFYLNTQPTSTFKCGDTQCFNAIAILMEVLDLHADIKRHTVCFPCRRNASLNVYINPMPAPLVFLSGTAHLGYLHSRKGTSPVVSLTSFVPSLFT